MDVDVHGQGSYVFGQFRVDPRRHVLTYRGERVAVRPTVLNVLIYLIKNSDRAVEKDELLEAVWPGRVVEEANLSQSVFWLRALLREHAGEAGDNLVVTVRGRGYRFVGDVAWEPPYIAGAQPHPSPAPPAPQAPQALSAQEPIRTETAPARGRTVAFAAAALATALLVAAGIFALLHVTRPSPTFAHGNTIVLADFQNRTHDPAFDRTLDDVLRIDLGQSPFVAVMPEKQARDTLTLMMQPADAPLTPALAQDVCTRTNADAVLSGVVDALGSRYILTLNATDCSGRRALAGATVQAATREGVVPALEQLISKVRRKLGEPLQSVDRFDVPLAPERTASLDALKAYSQGLWLNDHGRRNEALPLFKHAIELDPKLAGAYVGLMVVYAGTNQDSLAADAISRAYQLRDTLNERQRLAVATLYSQFYKRDYDEASRILGIWTTVYPLDPKAWGNLANVDNMLGRYEQALEPAKRALALNAGSEQPYVVLARTYLRLGRADLARSIGAQAIKHGVDGDAIHAVLLAAAFALHDEAGMQREAAWGRAKAADRILLVVEGQIAYAQGKIREGDKMFDQSAELSREKGLPDFARFYRARLLNDLGLQDRARKLLATATDADDDDDDLIFTLAEVGDRARAAGLLAKQVRNHPEGTLITFDFEPEVRAALLLRQGQAPEAVAVLQKAIPYQSRTFDIPYLLGRSYLAAGDGVQAKTAFQLILDNPGWYPESPLYALARLGQARALRRQHDLAGARQAYQALFVSWKGADRDLPALKAAQYEYAHLGPP